MQVLIQHGADVAAQDNTGSTPLHLASSSGRIDTVRLLLKHSVDVNAHDESRKTPLHLASALVSAETASLLSLDPAQTDVYG